jgi:hypothetical protein
MFYDITLNKNTTVSQIIGYNRYYLIFTRPLNNILRQQLITLYTELSAISFTLTDDQIIWRWNSKGQFSTNSCYTWLNYGGIVNTQFLSIWKAYIALKIKIFLWLVK